MTAQATLLLGALPGETLDAAVGRMAALPAWRPFDDRAMCFVAAFSRRLAMDTAARPYPELLALAHWFRGARLRELAARQQAGDAASFAVGRGLAFHLAPANVDSIFMYSWLLSALAGNANIVRVSQKPSPQVDRFVAALHATLADPAVGHAMTGRLLLLTYPHEAEVTRAISQAAQLRVVWGGDATVAAIRAIPLRPTAAELVFPDRFSAAAFDAAAVLAADDAGLVKLAGAFYNDAFWFAQQACSSPRVLHWVGSAADIDAAKARFWSALGAELTRRAPDNTAAMTMARVVAAFDYAARGAVTVNEAPTGFPLRLHLQRPPDRELRDLHCGNGLFLEQSLASLATLAPQLDDRDQTLAVFGFGPAELQAFAAALPPRALDRIVPVGKALEFDAVWDGVDLLAAFSRRVRISSAT
ncbi:gamma-glutamyl phosphate reductase [Caenimonas sedimenti]|uniref:Gamma-glutamyl phosphate reductase n=1 Tax=Caenimonas sedimenti TaxID=2596921 RepID=A0A562ZHM4_9BURK|nr:acyl-CoA reductase [Caenimonas sedimenti]TWO67901.1 gamma-glutamyl phosphate reductase [Caenimonas sedimenti]